MYKPPCADRRSHGHQPDDLIAPEEAQLTLPGLSFGHLLEMRLDVELNHRDFLDRRGRFALALPHKYR